MLEIDVNSKIVCEVKLKKGCWNVRTKI